MSDKTRLEVMLQNNWKHGFSIKLMSIASSGYLHHDFSSLIQELNLAFLYPHPGI